MRHGPTDSFPTGHDPDGRREAIFVPRAELARLRSLSGNRIILFQIGIDYVVTRSVDSIGFYSVDVVSYVYRLLDRDERELLAFHWHPFGISNVTDPHLHLTGRMNPIDVGRDQEPLPLADMHIPTGFVTLEDVVRMLIAEVGITPRHADWDTILRENRASALAQQG